MGPAYQEALALERKGSARKPVNLGLLKRRVPPPACTLMDVFEGEYHPLFPPSGPRAPTVLVFWGQWCYSSRRLLGWLVQMARMHSSQVRAAAGTPYIVSSPTSNHFELALIKF